MTANRSSPAKDSIGNYDLLEKIGDGSMGVVYKARHWQSKETVAVKVMHAHIARNPVLLKRFEQEFRITSKLDHPNVVRAIEYCLNDGRPYLVMELVEGESLGEKLDRDGRMTEDDAVRTIVQVAHGLHRAHRQGLIHRDIKPDNILVMPDGKAKLTDLGLAKDQDANADLTRTGRGLGTPDFMAPEQFRNAKNASIRCDVYGLGATLYQMVTGELPFGEEEPVKAMMRKLKNELPPPRKLVPDLSERTDWAIRRAMSADPEQRPASSREFVEDLIGQSTRPASKPDLGGPEDTWYMVYTDTDGMVRTAKGSTKAIQNSLREGGLGDPAKVRASRNTTGPFDLLNQFPEFRDLVVAPAPGPPLSETSVANMSRLGRATLPSAAETVRFGTSPARKVTETMRVTKSIVSRDPDTPAKVPDEDAPAFNLGGTDTGGVSDGGVNWWKLLALVALTALTTLVASRFLFLSK